MKKILFIDNNQFGYLTDTYKYCCELKGLYSITYYCFDKGLPKLKCEGIKVIYVKRKGSKSFRALKFLICAVKHILFFKGFIFVVYFERFEYLKYLMPFKKMHLDVRTMSVHRDAEKREKKDKLIRKAASLFDSVSYISEGVGKKLNLSSKKRHYLLPLGSDIISQTDKSFSTLNLLYVGTLNNRNILKTIIGVEEFVRRHTDISLRYDIVGDGEELKIIQDYIESHHLSYIKTYGRIEHTELTHFFDSNNIGVSFVPITPYYDIQPPTKTFEYIFSGLFCIATSTEANKEFINKVNGVLIEDDEHSFAEGLETIFKMRQIIDSRKIRCSLSGYSWEEIVRKNLLPIIEKEY